MWPSGWPGRLAAVTAGVLLGVLALVLMRGPDRPEEIEGVRARPGDLPVVLDLRVEVLNGCGVPGAADRVAGILRRAGFQVIRVGNADHFHYEEDVVVARRVEEPLARPVAQVLGGVDVVVQRLPDHDVDVTVIVAHLRPLVPSLGGGS